MARFFLDRPVFAIVISLFLVLAGVLTMRGLPVAQFPDIAPPTVTVNTVYPGADAEAVIDSVISPMDSQINGVTDMRYIRAVAGNDGSARIQVTFALERDADIAAVETQNRVSQVTSRLPAEVNDVGVAVAKSSPDVLMFAALYSHDGSRDRNFLDNYLNNYWVDELKRVPGVGDLQVFGSEFGMRIWLQPDRMAALGLTAQDVILAVQEQNKQAAAGQVGQAPADSESGFQYSLTLKGRLKNVDEFENIVLRANTDGSLLRLKDVARVELGAKDYNIYGYHNEDVSSAFAVYLSPGANAMSTSQELREKMDALSEQMPSGMEYSVVYDTSNFVKASIDEVVKTFVEALLLVTLVVFLFLQNWRATVIPMIAVPISLVATFISYQVLGFSINTLSLFGMVLAIGIVVDDAIVVVEAVEEKMENEGLSALEATKKAMNEVSGALVAMALVLAVVFIPMALVPGVTGQLYKQFALTIAVSTLFSALIALTLSPVMCAGLLKHRHPGTGILGRFFTAFNRGFDRFTKGYLGLTGKMVRGLKRLVLFFLIILICIVTLGKVTPTGFVPEEDQGAFFVQALLPEASSTKRTEAVVADLSEQLQALPGVEAVLGITGFDLLTQVAAPNGGLLVVQLKDWAERSEVNEQVDSLIAQAQQIGAQTEEALVFAFNPPALPGYGAVSGVSMMLQAERGQSPTELDQMSHEFIAAAMQRPEIAQLSTTYAAATPNYRLEVDREKIKQLGVPISDVFGTLQVFLGSYQVNDFTLFGENYRVSLQAAPEFRRDIETLSQLHVRNAAGDMLPLDTLVSYEPSTSPRYIMRYNLYPTAELTGTPAAGYSSGQAVQALKEVAAEVLPDGYGYQWSGQTLEEVESGNTGTYVLMLSIVVVFLFLAALYESWSVPFAVLLAVPFGLLGVFGGLQLMGMEFNVYGQIGLVTLVGLSAKNAILIVEYAKLHYEKKGYGLVEAAMEAARLRLRPILMTSFAFILGVLPLMLASGAGAASKNSVGVVVFFGMLVATMSGVFFVPAFYVLVQTLTDWVKALFKGKESTQ
ncbi:efflux RND transporter permease subunit [Halopseudomonas maritima]|uniref:efflux RND transporter permease subunit n=1 Tax=Halopseudomonas maritima TaxID=2918528 RepID=UPI001EECCAAA|nr:multidrug efflux RND transporter permease subunit [Halopseudomonas maritima]UJJ32517.1 multidrug efflux RND transporter permease subunit [Halopseudomonas maritima]